MANSKFKKLLEAEDSFNIGLSEKVLSFSSESNTLEDEGLGELSLKSEVKLSDKPISIKEESHNPEQEDEILSLIRQSHSGLFYKIDNHLNILSLSGHFRNWKNEEKFVFGFYSFDDVKSSLDSLVCLSAFFEHKDNFNSLILCDDNEYPLGHKHKKQDAFITLSDHIKLQNIYDFITELADKSYDEELEKLKQSFDFIFLMLPKEVEQSLKNEAFKKSLFCIDKINYFFNSKGTKRDEIHSVRNRFKKLGLEEGGMILGEDCV